MRLRGARWLVVPVLWSAHTLAAIFVVGVVHTSFGRHKIEQGFTPSDAWVLLIGAHAVLACLALITGAIAARETVHGKRFRTVHRISGRIYALSVLGSGLLSLPLLPHVSGGLGGQIGLTGLLVGWLASTAWAVRAIRQQQLEAHRRWMTRSYALTFANLVLHVSQTMLIRGLGLDRESAYQWAALCCAPLCLLVAEIVIRRRRPAPPRSAPA